MVKTIRSFYIVILLIVISLFSGCDKGPSIELTPQSFTTDFAALVAARDEKALAAYEGNVYQLNAKAEGILSDHALISCSENAKIRIYVSESELQELKRDEIIAFEGTVKEVETEKWNDKYSAEMVIEDAHVIGTTFEITGHVEEIYWDYTRDEQYYAAIWDSSVVIDRQINIYLPDEHTLEVGDRFTARGTLMYPSSPAEYTVAYIRGDGGSRDFPEVFVMPEPEFIRKEEGE